jgi:hypothetical protein
MRVKLCIGNYRCLTQLSHPEKQCSTEEQTVKSFANLEAYKSETLHPINLAFTNTDYSAYQHKIKDPTFLLAAVTDVIRSRASESG